MYNRDAGYSEVTSGFVEAHSFYVCVLCVFSFPEVMPVQFGFMTVDIFMKLSVVRVHHINQGSSKKKQFNKGREDIS